MKAFFSVIVGLCVGACGGPLPSDGPTVEYAIAIHGGAGTIERDMNPAVETAYREALAGALGSGKEMLDQGRSSLDVVEQVVRILEDDPLFNAGKGAVFTHEGINELDAAIMDGETLGCGSITGVTNVKNPISLARKVMENSPHVFFSGAGAEAFAQSIGIEFVKPGYFFTQRRWDSLQEALDQEPTEKSVVKKHGTVGAVALDRQGHLAAATSTGGMTNKRFGRVGDVPVIGAGTFADDRTAAISCTGHGEQFIRHTVASRVSASMEFGGASLTEAAQGVIYDILNRGDGGLIAIDRDGNIAMEFSTLGMYRGAADSSGRFEVAIWDQ